MKNKKIRKEKIRGLFRIIIILLFIISVMCLFNHFNKERKVQTTNEEKTSIITTISNKVEQAEKELKEKEEEERKIAEQKALEEQQRLEAEQKAKEEEERRVAEEQKRIEEERIAKQKAEEEARRKAEQEKKARQVAQSKTVTSRSDVDRTTAKQTGEWITFNVSFYCPCAKCCGKTNGITASGAKAQAGVTIAAPSNYAFGTQIYLEGMGTYTVQDRGGAIQGNKIDVFVNSHQEALNLGRKQIRGYVVK